MIALFGHDGRALPGDDFLSLKENFPGNDGFVDRLDVFREPLAFDEASIERIC